MGCWHFLTLSLCFFLCLLSHIIYVSSLRLPKKLYDNHNIIHGPKVRFDPTLVTQVSWHPRYHIVIWCNTVSVITANTKLQLQYVMSLEICLIILVSRAFLYKGFLSEKECNHLINKAKVKLRKSMVADNESGKGLVSEVRTSSGMFFTKAQDKIIAEIEDRIATWTFLPIDNGEPIQVLRYEHGQKYEPHFDYFNDKYNIQFGGHRMATVLMYLSNVEKGGETVFPDSELRLSQRKDNTWSECARAGYAVKPKKGDALLFFSLHLNATTDIMSLHQSCPVIQGEKWSATKWIHVRDPNKLFKNIY